ncbi:hypothetical protein SISSUDRAFT_973884, partial [Sistotremastrum suecicum HHB10207 ss-3]
IRNVQDAAIIFEAVRLGILPLIQRRLSAAERDLLKSGDVFVWEEADHKKGLERWTDGRRWSQSRMRNEFLYYDEKLPTTQAEKEAKAVRRAAMVSAESGNPSKSPPTRRSDRPTKPNGLTKQTYSTIVRRKSPGGAKKWHLVAYFATSQLHHLSVIDDYEYLRGIQIPEGIFLSGRAASA